MTASGALAWRSWLVRARSSLAGQLAWSLVGNVLAALWSLAIAVLAARRLDTGTFGRLSLLLSAQMVLATFMASAIGQTAARLTAELRHRELPRLRRVTALLTLISTGFSCAVALLYLGGGSVVHAAALGPHAAGPAVLGAALVLLCAGLAALQQGLLTGYGAFRALALSNGVRAVVGVAVLVLGPPTLANAVLAVGAGAVAGLAVGEWAWIRVHRGDLAHLPWGEWRREVRVLWSFAVPSWLTGTLFVVAAWLGNILTARQAGGLAEVGLFNAAGQWGRSLVLFVPNAIVAPLLVTMAGHVGKGDLAAVSRVARQGLALSLATTLAPCAVVYLLDSRLLSLYGPAYARALPVLHLLLLSTAVASLTVVTNATLFAVGRIWTVATLTAFWAATFLVTLLVAPAGGARGLAVAYLAGYVVQVAATVPQLRRVLRVAPAA